MPAGPEPLGLAYFAAVKFAGYTGAAWALNRSFQSRENNVWKVGGARTALGLVVGAAYGVLFMKSPSLAGHSAVASTALYFAGLLPIRLGEWSLVIWYFYQRGKPDPGRLLRNSALGIVWSFVLDAAGIYAAFVAPGGVWIC